MDNSVMSEGFLSCPTSGLLELEPSIHRHQQSHFGHAPHSHNNHIVQAMNVITGFESDHSVGLMGAKGTALKGISPSCGKGKGIIVASNAASINNSNNTSEEDEPSFTEVRNNAHFNGVKGKKGSPWQRMRWADNIVRLLIGVVSSVGILGDDSTLEGAEGMKRKSGMLQKKGKWKTVSKIMINRGCFVSPQQCEDKFNDLNKRYKRLNEILGSGTTCRVVENPILLDSMTQLSAKIKDDVRKILSLKHLFYKEMCAYHNGQRIPNCDDLDVHSSHFVRCSKGRDGFEEEEDEENEDCSDEDLNNGYGNNVDENVERMGVFGNRKKVNEEDGSLWSQSGSYDSFSAEMAGILQDPKMSHWEQQEWIKNQRLQLQEQRVRIQAQALELEKRRFEWQKFCNKKERELESLRLDNERMILENERMTLQVKQKEQEIGFKMSEASLVSVSLGMGRLQGRDQIEFGRVH
ncbi:hypothetical protein HHK36_011944 [Tetracentron sinense]|uniref:Myb/SANT-like DNA-binding domain-containing protein n=1 Tax=Tetracentron sinense TaxID=13715 RepID=A0A834ZER7_TETSI|nr:hypothetical protein HHK36_011944 [Tetracentron sinense]